MEFECSQTNFGGNIPLMPRRFYAPRDESEVLEILARHQGDRIRCVGRLHSWSRIVESTDVLLDLQHLNAVQAIEGDEPSAWIGAGCQIKQVLDELKRLKGWTLPSVGFVTEQSIAGAVSTGTHGSGRHSLSHYVQAVRFARYDRETGNAVIQEISEGPQLTAAKCCLGCLGVILSVRMACRSSYSVEEHFREYQGMSEVIAAEQEYPLQQFYLVPWRWTFVAQHRRETEQPQSRDAAAYHWYRFLVFDIAMHLMILFALRVIRAKKFVRWLFRWPIPACVIRNWRVVGPSTTQLVMEHERFRHVEMELFVSRERLEDALRFLRHVLAVAGSGEPLTDVRLRSQLASADCDAELGRLAGTYCHHYPICVRRILADDTMISMASSASAEGAGDPWYSISLINYHAIGRSQPFERLAAMLARSMAFLFGARPHWGKLCPLPAADLRNLYPRFSEFASICEEVDSNGTFRNDWTHDLLNGRTASSK